MKRSPRIRWPLAALCCLCACAFAGAAEPHPLAGLQFKATAAVRSDMRWVVKTQECYYVETPENWSCRWGGLRGGAAYPYVWQKDPSAPSGLCPPPLGVRSAVPLGGLGAGTVELRADGSFCDWNIFNNSPGGGGAKVQLGDALLGLWLKAPGAPAKAWTLRTHPPSGLPPIHQIEYAGAYPVSRLRFTDPGLPLAVELYAYNEWFLGDADRSGTPAVLFTLVLSNASPEQVEAALLFNLPNHQPGVAAAAPRGLVWDKSGTDSLSGSICLEFAGPQAVSRTAGDDLNGIWSAFARNGSLNDDGLGRAPKYGAVATRLTVPAGGARSLDLALAWYLPNRLHDSGRQRIGNYYTRLYSGAEEVAAQTLSRLPQTWDALKQWQQLCFDNDLPEWLQDALINSAATMAKTGFRAEDGRWRQWESFSCSAVDPVHIHWYRALPYAFLFPGLQQSEFRGFASRQRPDGFVYEDLGGGGKRLDDPGGRDMGDCTSAFILGIYQIYLWGGDRPFLDELWPHVRRAAQWQIQRSGRFGLPDHLNNTYDWWGFERKDVVAYNAMMHLAAMRAAERLAALEGEPDFAAACRRNYESGARRLDELLWNGRFFRAWWMQPGDSPEALHADTLYGQVWASILGLGWITDPAKVQAHLAAERSLCASPYGLEVMHGRGSDPIDDLVWQAGSLDWTTASLYLGAPAGPSLDEAKKVVDNWRSHLRDFWDWRDLTRSDDGQPWCNSHYARQVILWAIPLALSGQQYSAPEQRLSFAPRPDAPARLPWFIPGAGGVLERGHDGQFTLRVLTGELELKQWSVANARSPRAIKLHAGEAAVLGASAPGQAP